ncbi:MAG: RHS repeat-associated core domain-containing protein, partial [Ekhidna sp.]
QISTAAQGVGAHDSVTLDLPPFEQDGYVLAYLSNENQEAVNVNFDDFTIYHGKTNVVSTQDYYPFGLTFNESVRTASEPQLFQFNGKETIEELGWIDYGARMYMPDIGRWFNVDPLAGEYMMHSPYHYTYNNPINYIDPDGRRIDPVKTKDEVDENGVRQIEVTFNISIKILNNSRSGVNMNELKGQLRSMLKEAFSGSYGVAAANLNYTFKAGDISIDNVSSMDQVSESDHVLTIVDDVEGKAVDKNGNVRDAAGMAEYGMKNLWSEGGSAGEVAERTVHELGHSARRNHSWQDNDESTNNSQNYMSYDRDCPCDFSGSQLLDMFANRDKLNQGKNWTRATGEEGKVTKTTQLSPDSDAYKGKKIPRPVGKQ